VHRDSNPGNIVPIRLDLGAIDDLILQLDFVIFMLAWLLRVVRCEHRTSL